MEALFEAFIDTIAKAFDEKCSFTGNHVKQVAELAQIIANAIDQDQQVYPNVSYNKAMLKTINIAALLHDVGKITTPEFIMQKSSKLQKIYDRIDLIQHRIEILKRDTHIAHLQAQLAQQKGDKPNDKPSNELDNAAYLRTLTELDEAYAFLQKMNTGNEFLAPAHAQKITDLAQKTYQLGSQTVPLLNADELTNLCIQRGTLNAEERTKIMDHARVSLSMLQTLPFPQKYQRVVDIAANHHEKLDGSGYPRGLTAEQLTLEDRILILADLYEALSAQDRPYKEPHTLADIAKILSSMANAGAIDKTLLAFFFESGAYQAYNRFLKPSQINDFSLTLE
jgi:response regulator RpfG family c-di-GMP phosphodiesterase